MRNMWPVGDHPSAFERNAVMLDLSRGEYLLVYNALSFVTAAMGAAVIYFLVTIRRLGTKHQAAAVCSAIICAIAAYHYSRIFSTWKEARTTGFSIDKSLLNEGYRYADWLLTVPLLLTELILVLGLAAKRQKQLITRLVIAAVLMVALGYPGEVATKSSAQTLWGVLSTLPFLYILYVLFVELGKAGVVPAAQKKLNGLRYLILGVWGVYPIAYMLGHNNPFIDDPATAEVVRQVGYSVADVLAKPMYGLIIVGIALTMAKQESPAHA
jgi:bacteriorhodopsin